MCVELAGGVRNRASAVAVREPTCSTRLSQRTGPTSVVMGRVVDLRFSVVNTRPAGWAVLTAQAKTLSRAALRSTRRAPP